MPLQGQEAELLSVGLTPACLARLAEVRPEVFLLKPPTIRRKLKFLREVVGLR